MCCYVTDSLSLRGGRGRYPDNYLLLRGQEHAGASLVESTRENLSVMRDVILHSLEVALFVKDTDCGP